MADQQFAQTKAFRLLPATLCNSKPRAPGRTAIEKNTNVFDFKGQGFESQKSRFKLNSLAQQLEAFLLSKQLYKPAAAWVTANFPLIHLQHLHLSHDYP
jgi:hypothetical protein